MSTLKTRPKVVRRTAMVRARVNPQLKMKAEAVLDRIGLLPSQAVNMFYAQILLQNGLPFEARIPNAETVKAMKAALQGKVRKSKNSADLYRQLGI